MRKRFCTVFTLVLAGIILLSGILQGMEVRAQDETEIPEKCTGVYIGKAVSAEGTMIIARSEDQQTGAYAKLFTVIPAEKGSKRLLRDTSTGFSLKIPNDTLKYTAIPDASGYGDGQYFACCMNEAGVNVIGTVTTSVCPAYAALDPLKSSSSGIREAILAAIPACQAVSAEDAVNILANCIDRHGSAEYNTVLISDKKEAWIFEIYGGFSYAAMRLPDDKAAVFGNQIMLDWIDFSDTEGWVVSKNLKKNLENMGQSAVKDSQGRYHLAKTISGSSRDDYSNMRTWRGHMLLAPSQTDALYVTSEFYPLLFTPDNNVSVIDVMKLFGDRYAKTDYDMEKKGNSGLRPIGTVRQSDVHIIQTFDSLPDCCCHVQWLSMGNAEHCIFVPAFSGITETYEKYRVDNITTDTVTDSYFYVCRRNAALAESDRTHLSNGLKNFNLAEEQKMLKAVIGALETVQARYNESREAGDAYVTEFSRNLAEEQYKNALAVFNQLTYTMMYNDSDGKDQRNFKFSSRSAQANETGEIPSKDPGNFPDMGYDKDTGSAGTDGWRSLPFLILAGCCSLLLIAVIVLAVLLCRKTGNKKADLNVLKMAAEYLESQPKVTMDPYPDYDSRVMAALGTLKSDYQYLEHHSKLEGKAVDKMTLNDLATMYTFILRGERFCDGHIASFIEDGSLLRLINRHIELLEGKR